MTASETGDHRVNRLLARVNPVGFANLATHLEVMPLPSREVLFEAGIVAHSMQKAGLIRYSRGVIAVTNRRGLEEAACECYGIVKRAFDEILPPAPKR